MSKNMIVVKGTSATGKGTRVVQILEFLKTHYDHQVVTFEDTYGKTPKTRPLGILFPDLKLLFIGCYTISNKSGLTSWTSMDYLHASVKKGEYARAILKEWVDQDLTLVCEGEALLQSDKWRPEFMYQYYGLDNLSILYFYYQNRAQYDERVVGRSGKVAGDSGWSRNESYPKEFGWCLNEMETLGFALKHIDYGTQPDVIAVTNGWSEFALCYHNSPLYVVGNVVIQTLRKEGVVDIPFKSFDFYNYCDMTPMLRSIGNADPLAGRVEAKPKAPEKPSKKVIKEVAEVVAKKSVSILDRMRGAK